MYIRLQNLSAGHGDRSHIRHAYYNTIDTPCQYYCHNFLNFCELPAAKASTLNKPYSLAAWWASLARYICRSLIWMQRSMVSSSPIRLTT